MVPGAQDAGRRPGRGAVWVLLAVALLAAASDAPGAPGSGTQDQLRRTRQNLRRERGDLRELTNQLEIERRRITQGRRRERSILQEIQLADQRVEAAEDRYAENQQNLALVRESLVNIRAAMTETETGLGEMRRQLADRLRLLHREGGLQVWRVLIASRSLADVFRRLKFFHVLAAQNAYWVERLTLTRGELDHQKLELAERELQARDLEAESLRALEQVKARKAERERVLSQVRDERVSHEEAVRELTAAAQRLNALIERLERKTRELERRAAEAERQKRLAAEAAARRAAVSKGRPAPTPAPTPRPTPPPAVFSHKIPWPTRGRVVTLFGRVKHPRFNTYLLNKGIDIAGPLGQNVNSVAPGRVLFAEWFEGYGRMVILDHGDGVNTVYAHLARITVSEGQSVAAGQTLGTLGDSGTWKGPALYFEIRQRGQALDPLLWLGR